MATKKTETAGDMDVTGMPPRRRAARSVRGDSGGMDLRSDLRDFVREHPEGWGHDEWTGLLGRLRERGHDTEDSDRIGSSLERERLAMRLEQVPGVGPQRVKSLVDRYETLWSARRADADEMARTAGIPRALAEKISEALR